GCQGRLDLLGGWVPMSDQPRAAGATPGLSTASPTGAHTVVGDLAGLFGNIPIGIFPTKPKQNYCVYFGPRSVIATELDFSSCLEQPHTIAGCSCPSTQPGHAMGRCSLRAARSATSSVRAITVLATHSPLR